MDLVKNSFEFTLRKRKWVVLLALCGFSSYGVYKVYHLPSVSRKRKRFIKLLGALVSMVEMMSDSAETLSVVFKELKEFLESDSDQIPKSLGQLSKIAVSDEFSLSLSRVSEALTIGVIQGAGSSSLEIGKVGLSNQIMDKLMSRSGTGFVSVVVGSFARNLVLGFYSNENKSSGLKFVAATAQTSGLPEWLCSEKSKLVMGDCIKTFVSTAVAVYLDKTTNVNFYDDMFSGLTDPKHQKQVRDILVSICNGAVETFIKTSHQVLTSSSKSTEDDSKDKTFWGEEKPLYDMGKSGWVNSVSSTLSVASNRRLVLDVTGRVTFETIRSLINFFLWKVSDVVRRSLNDEVLGKGLEVVNYVGAKSCVILTICLALYLHIINGHKAFLPAA